MADKITEISEQIVEAARKRGLTAKQQRFTREMIANPGNATEAAIRAGYSPNSARVTASRLLKDPDIQSVLAQHFVDEEQELSLTLQAALLRISQIVHEGSDKKFLSVMKPLLEYTRLANNVLGLNVKREKASVEINQTATVEDLIEQHRAEIERLEHLQATRPAVSTTQAGKGEVQ